MKFYKSIFYYILAAIFFLAILTDYDFFLKICFPLFMCILECFSMVVLMYC